MINVARMLDIWGGYVIWATLPWLLSALASLVHRLLKSRLEQRFGDDLPLTTGQWVAQQLAKRGLTKQIQLLVEPKWFKLGNAFSSKFHAVLLTPETYFKSNPVSWSIGAHELSHGLICQRRPWLMKLHVFAQALSGPVLRAAVCLLLANVAYGQPGFHHAARQLLIVGTVLASFVALSEGLCSAVALLMLGDDSRLTPAQRRGSLATLISAGMTYASLAIGQLLVLGHLESLWKVVEEHHEFQPAPLPSGWSHIDLVITTVLLSVHVIGVVLWQLGLIGNDSRSKTPLQVAFGQSGSLWQLAAASLITLLWNQPLGGLFAASVVLATLATGEWLWICFYRVALLLNVIGLGLFVVLMPLLMAIVGGDLLDSVQSPEFIAAKRAGKDDILRSDSELRKLLTSVQKSWLQRLMSLGQIAYVPMLILFWVNR